LNDQYNSREYKYKKEDKKLRQQQFIPPSSLTTPLRKKRHEDSNETVEGHLWPLRDVTHVARMS